MKFSGTSDSTFETLEIMFDDTADNRDIFR